MRSYNLLIKKNKTEQVAKIKNLLAGHPITGGSLNDNFKSNKNTCLHQFLVYRLLGIEFNKALLTAISHPKNKLYYPLPRQWRKRLINQGFNIPPLINMLLWINFNLKWFLIGLATGLLELFRTLSRLRIKAGTSTAYFDKLYPGNFIQNDFKESKNILEWFSDQKESKDIERIFHSCKDKLKIIIGKKEINYAKSPIPKISSFPKFIKFLLWFILNSFKVLFITESRLIFRELVFNRLVKLSYKEELFFKYFFHNSGHILRPLWTYEAERKGSEIIFYFYSTNISSFKIRNKPFIQDSQWQVVNWPIYWVWNEKQNNFLRSNLISRFNTKIKGIIPFTCSDKRLDLLKYKEKPCVIVFDVQPVKNYFYSALAPSVNFYSEKNTIIFLDWINQLAIDYDINIIIKRKRYNNLISKNYIKKIATLKKTPLWDEIDPSIDANSVLEGLNPKATISIPFTSTAFISRAKKIPSIYLDPTGKLDKEFHLNDEIPLLSSKENLFHWYKNLHLNKLN